MDYLQRRVGQDLAIRLKPILLVHQQLHELGMDKQFLPACLLFGKHADLHQFFQVDGGGLAFGDAFFDQVVDAAVRLLEEGVDQFATLGAG